MLSCARTAYGRRTGGVRTAYGRRTAGAIHSLLGEFRAPLRGLAAMVPCKHSQPSVRLGIDRLHETEARVP